MQEHFFGTFLKDAKKAQSRCRLTSALIFLFLFYEAYACGAGAPTGQTSAQAPQSTHLSASIE